MAATPVERKILAVLPLVSVVVGTIGNCFTLFICLQKKLRPKQTFVFLAFLSVADTICLYFYNLNDFLITFHNTSIDGLNAVLCKVALFSNNIGVYASSWLLAIMSIERCLHIRCKFWKQKAKFNSTKALYVSMTVFVIAVTVNIPQLYATEYLSITNRTVNYYNTTGDPQMCLFLKLKDTLSTIAIYTCSIIPFVLIAIANVLLIQTIIEKKSDKIQRSDKQKQKRRSISISIMVITLLFIIQTLPWAVVIGYYLDSMRRTYNGRIILSIVMFLNYAFHATSFFVFYSTNKVFRDEFLSIFCKCFRHKLSTLISTRYETTDKKQ